MWALMLVRTSVGPCSYVGQQETEDSVVSSGGRDLGMLSLEFRNREGQLLLAKPELVRAVALLQEPATAKVVCIVHEP